MHTCKGKKIKKFLKLYYKFIYDYSDQSPGECLYFDSRNDIKIRQYLRKRLKVRNKDQKNVNLQIKIKNQKLKIKI